MTMVADGLLERRFVEMVRGEASAHEMIEKGRLGLIADVLTKSGFKVLSVRKSHTYRSGYMAIERRADGRATAWLEAIWVELRFHDHPKKALVAFLKNEMERSVPLRPITLTEYGDQLRENPPEHGLNDHTRDHDRLSLHIGTHDCCDGYIEIKASSASHNVVHCRTCHLRLPIPIAVDTYGKLREHFTHLQ